MRAHPFIRLMIMNYIYKRNEMTGYEFIKFCRSNGIMASSGTVYPNLKALEEEGIIEFRQDGKRKIYILTKEGRSSIVQTIDVSIPDMIKDAFFKNISLASNMNWGDVEDLNLLLSNVDIIRNYIALHLQSLTGETETKKKRKVNSNEVKK